jgi:hypothetical protein
MKKKNKKVSDPSTSILEKISVELERIADVLEFESKRKAPATDPPPVEVVEPPAA